MRSTRSAYEIAYHSVRDDRSVPAARFDARYRATGPPRAAEPGSFDAWATDRLRLFSADKRGRIWRSEIAHAPWPLQPAEGTIEANELAAVHGLELPAEPPRLLFAARQDVRGWLPVLAR
jgi:uncharacterized protein YqjF (DUF2071 family)